MVGMMDEQMDKWMDEWEGKQDLPKAEITVPSVTKDLLMLAPSFNLSPVNPVASALSL